MAIITVSGLPGSGTSTTCKLLQEKLGWPYVNAGDFFRLLATDQGISLAEMGRRAEADGHVDRQLDERMVQFARQEKELILEGRLTGWMATRQGLPALKVWCQAPLEVRAGRVGQREGQAAEEAMRDIGARERSEHQRYHRHHQIDLDDLTIYDLVLDTAELSPEQVVARILETLEPPR
ncbi:MAG: cytidylate kinase [Candidatus Latescibacteria bacterium]|nr:cytidylate kinase [Candidatus Latescibacterota bacterium]